MPDPAEDLLGLLVGLLLGELLLLDEAAELALRDLAGLLEALVDELLLDVLQHHVDAGGGNHLGDLAAHRAGADDGGFENEHEPSNGGRKRRYRLRGGRRGCAAGQRGGSHGGSVGVRDTGGGPGAEAVEPSTPSAPAATAPTHAVLTARAPWPTPSLRPQD